MHMVGQIAVVSDGVVLERVVCKFNLGLCRHCRLQLSEAVAQRLGLLKAAATFPTCIANQPCREEWPVEGSGGQLTGNPAPVE